MEKLGNEAERLCLQYPDRSTAINAKMAEARDRWETLKTKAQLRKLGLDRSYNRHRFLADFHELSEWIRSMRAMISASELAKDVAGAEALLETHQEHRGFI
jgi:hypothetical protein